MIRYELDQSDLQHVKNSLFLIEKKVPRVIKNAINHTAKWAKKELAAGMQASYTVKSAGLNSRIKIQNATMRNMCATIHVKDRTLTIGRFHTTAPKSGGKADIKKNGLKALKLPLSDKKEAKAFKRKGLIMQRTTEERYPVKALRSVSVPKMLEKVYQGEHGMKGALDPMIQKTLHDEIDKEIDKVICQEYALRE